MIRRLMGWMLLLGWGGVAVAMTAAERWHLLLAANDGSVDAMVAVALDCDAHSDSFAACRIAEVWYKKAAEHGVAEASLRLGKFYEGGWAVPQSYKQARDCYEKAMAGGLPEANLSLAMLYLDGLGVEADRDQWAALVRLAAEAGYGPAENILSQMYFTGIGVAKDIEEAVVWAEKGARAEKAEGEYSILKYGLRGLILSRDQPLIRSWHRSSVNDDYLRVMATTLLSFFEGKTTDSDRAVIERWLTLEVEGGNDDARLMLAALLGAGASDDAEARAKAVRLLEEAERLDDTQAPHILHELRQGNTFYGAFLYVLTTPYEERCVKISADEAAAVPSGQAHPPTITKIVRATYPKEAEALNLEGRVTIRFVVDVDGQLRDPEVVSSPNPILSRSALAVLKKWKFEPGSKLGLKLKMRTQVTLGFRMDDYVELALKGT